jgi:outer membrane lipoprotein-sorting protein
VIRLTVAIVFLAVALLGGCAPKPAPTLPAYRWVDEQTALNDLRTRAASVKTVSAECTITLAKPDGETVTLDGALAMRNPGWLRLRAWKFNRAVFDLTLQPGGLWVMTMDDPARQEQVVPASANAAEFMKQWSYFNGELFELASADRSKVEGRMFVVRPTDDVKHSPAAFRNEVDRATLTPRRYVYEEEGPRFELEMLDYRQINDVLWPTKLIARGEMGTVTIEQRNVEINAELAPNAFVPPRRAEKRQ